MPRTFHPFQKKHAPSFHQLFQPAIDAMIGMTPLEARGNRSLQMSFEEQLKALVFFHLEEHTSAQNLLQVLDEDDFARDVIAPKDGIKKDTGKTHPEPSTFSLFYSSVQIKKILT